MPRLGQVVRLLVQLALRLGHQTGDLDLEGEQVEQPQQDGDVVDVAVDRARHARVLHLDREVAAVRGARAVHLADRRRGDRLRVEALETPRPARTPFATEHAMQLRARHRARARAQRRQGARELRRHHVLAFQGQELAELHRRTPQAREAGGEALRARRGQEHAAGAAGLRGREPPQPLDRAADGELAGGEPEAHQPPDARLRHRRALPAALRGHAPRPRAMFAAPSAKETDTHGREGTL